MTGDASKDIESDSLEFLFHPCDNVHSILGLLSTQSPTEK